MGNRMGSNPILHISPRYDLMYTILARMFEWLRSETQVLVAQAAWVQIPFLAYFPSRFRLGYFLFEKHSVKN